MTEIPIRSDNVSCDSLCAFLIFIVFFSFLLVELYNILCGKFGAEYKEVFEPQPLACKIKKIQPATAQQIKYLKDLMAYHGIEEQIEYDKLSKNEASKKIDKIISKKGRIFGFENK